MGWEGGGSGDIGGGIHRIHRKYSEENTARGSRTASSDTPGGYLQTYFTYHHLNREICSKSVTQRMPKRSRAVILTSWSWHSMVECDVIFYRKRWVVLRRCISPLTYFCICCVFISRRMSTPSHPWMLVWKTWSQASPPAPAPTSPPASPRATLLWQVQSDSRYIDP